MPVGHIRWQLLAATLSAASAELVMRVYQISYLCPLGFSFHFVMFCCLNLSVIYVVVFGSYVRPSLVYVLKDLYN